MNETIKKLLFLFAILSVLQPAWSMFPVTTDFQRNPEASGNILCNERINIHTDRGIYIAGEMLFFKICLTSLTDSLSGKSNIGYLILRDIHNNPIIRQNILFAGSIAYGSLLLPDTLRTGLYQLIAFTNNMRNFGESQFCYHELIIANRFDEELEFDLKAFHEEKESGTGLFRTGALTVKTNKDSYQAREKVTISMNMPGDALANLSVSVAEAPGTEKRQGRKPAGKELLPAGSRNACKSMIEDRGYIVSGSVSNPASGIVVMLSVSDSLANLMYSITDGSGRFFFQLDSGYYDRELFIRIADQSGSNASSITLDNKYAVQDPALYDFTGISNELRQFIRKSQTIAGIHKTYQIKAVVEETARPLKAVSRRVYYQPDNLLLTADYLPMNNINEIIREALPFVRLNRTDNYYEVEILDPENKTTLKHPAIFINGMPAGSINPIVNLGSDKIKRVETIWRRRVFGSLELNGILAVFTTADVKNDEYIDQKTLAVEPVNFLKPSQFIIPDYSTSDKRSDRNPDFRQLLYWNPQVFLRGGKSLTVEFYTSDNIGSYVININGINSDGSLINYDTTFDVY